MLSITLLFVLAATIITLVSAVWGRVPLWVAVLLLCIVHLLGLLPR